METKQVGVFHPKQPMTHLLALVLVDVRPLGKVEVEGDVGLRKVRVLQHLHVR